LKALASALPPAHALMQNYQPAMIYEKEGSRA
jgi:hypothetical protein